MKERVNPFYRLRIPRRCMQNILVLNVCRIRNVFQMSIRFFIINRHYNNTDILGFFFKGIHLHRSIALCNPDVVHLHGPNACVYKAIISEGIKIVVTMHGLIGLDSTIANQSYLYKMEYEICKSNHYSMIGFIAQKLISEF